MIVTSMSSPVSSPTSPNTMLWWASAMMTMVFINTFHIHSGDGSVMRRVGLLLTLLFFLPLFIMNKIIKYRCCVFVCVDHLQYHLPFLWGYLLCISAVRNRLVFVVFQTYVS